MSGNNRILQSVREFSVRYKSGFFWNIVNTLFTQGGTLLINIMVARWLGREAFGEFSLILGTLLTVAGIAQLSTGVAATKFVAQYRSNDLRRTGNILGLCALTSFLTGLIAMIAVMLTSGWVSEALWNHSTLASWLLISAPYILFSAMNGYQAGALAGFEEYRVLARMGIALSLTHLALCISGVMLAGLSGLFVALSLSAFIRWLSTGIVLRKITSALSITICYGRSILAEKDVLTRFALPGAIAGLTSMPALWIGSTLLVREANGYAELGGYNAANNLRVIMLMLPILLNSVGTSVLNHCFGRQDHEDFARIFRSNLIATLLLATAGTTIMLIFGPWLMGWFGSEFVDGSRELLLVMSIAILPEAVTIALYQRFMIDSKLWLSFTVVVLPRDVLIVVLAFYLIPLWQGVGFAVAYALGWGVALLLTWLLIGKMNRTYAG